MLPLFRWVLALYPPLFRTRFADEMLDVLAQVVAESSRKGLFARAVFACREVRGLLAGVMAEHLHARLGRYQWFHVVSSRRFNMRSEFRYPRATAPMMLVILGVILLVMYKARSIYMHQGDTYWMPDLPLVFGVALLLTCLAGVVGWLVLHSLHRSGVHRLSEAETWPQGK